MRSRLFMAAKTAILFILFASMMLFPFAVYSAGPPAPRPLQAPPVLEKRVESLEQRVAKIEMRMGFQNAAAPAVKRDVVKFYSADWCKFCPKVEELLKTNNVAYEKIETDQGPLPRIEWDGREVIGADSDAILALVGRTPKSTAQVVQTVSYSTPTPAIQSPVPSSSPSWTWPGNLRNHLLSGHGFSAQQLAGLSQSDLIALHNNSHNGVSTMGAAGIGGSSQVVRRQSMRSRRPLFFGGRFSRSGSCPGGNCP